MDQIAQKLGIVAAALDADPRVAISRSRATGFNGIEFDAISPAFDVTELSQTGKREFRNILAAQNQTLVGLRFDTGVKGISRGADVDRLLETLTKVMEAAQGLGAAQGVCVDVGPLPEPQRFAKPQASVTSEQAGAIIIPEMRATPLSPTPSSPPPDASVVGHVDGVLRELGVRADRIGITLALRSDLSSYAAVERAIAASGCPWFGVDLDPVAELRDEWSIDEIFSRLGGFVRHVRARDAIVGSDKRTKPTVIGRGSTDWNVLLSNLEAASYHGWVTIDPLEMPDRPAAAAVGAAHLREIAGTH